MRALPIVLALLPLGLAAAAAGPDSREIRALGADEVEGLRTGSGMGMALAAELNGYPGPRHVLDLAAELGLTAEQRGRTERIHAAMQQSAQQLGERVIAAEAALEAAFRPGTATPADVDRLTAELGAARAALQAVHLNAHLALRDVLDAHQRHRYAELRGYATDRPAPHRHGHGGHGG